MTHRPQPTLCNEGLIRFSHRLALSLFQLNRLSNTVSKVLVSKNRRSQRSLLGRGGELLLAKCATLPLKIQEAVLKRGQRAFPREASKMGTTPEPCYAALSFFSRVSGTMSSDVQSLLWLTKIAVASRR
jgi:hypothetical protein